MALNCIALFITINVLMCVFAEEEHYPDTYDNTDIKAILENAELREDYYKCFMEIEPCKAPGEEFFTEIFSEAYQTKCRRCTEKQKEIIRLATDWWMQNDPEKWQQIYAKSVEDMKKKNTNQ